VKLDRSHIVMAGAVLIGAGVLTIVRQALTMTPNPELDGLARWVAGTEFPGLILICAGVVLWAVGAVMRR
jgi:hypothetical protein